MQPSECRRFRVPDGESHAQHSLPCRGDGGCHVPGWQGGWVFEVVCVMAMHKVHISEMDLVDTNPPPPDITIVNLWDLS